MSKQDIQIAFKVEGLDGYITNLEELQDALKKVDKEQKEVSDSAKEQEKQLNRGGRAFKKLGNIGKAAFTGLKGAIAATGIGLLLTGVAQLVEWFTKTDAGAKILQGTMAGLGVIFEKITGFVTSLSEKIKPVFEDPIGAIKNFGNLVKQNIQDRINALLDTFGLLASAAKKLFEGDFSGALEDAGSAAKTFVMDVTLVGDVIDGVNQVVETAVETYNELAPAITSAIEASNKLIDSQNRLRKTQQDLTIENAKLNQELETQQKIADDTTLSFDERKKALDRVNAANEKLADNAIRLAQEEKAVLDQQIALATNDEERRELKDQLAEAEAALIDAETAAQIVRQESAQLNRELDQEEVDRKKSIKDIIRDLEQETIQDEEEAARRALELAEQQTLAELEQLDASEAEKEAVREKYRELRDQQDSEFAEKRKKRDEKEAEDQKKLEQEAQAARLSIASNALSAIASLQDAFASEDREKAERNFKIQKALALANATVTGVEATLNAFSTASKSPLAALIPGYAGIQAGIAAAFAAAQIATIARSKFQGGGTAPSTPPSTGGNAGNAINYNFDQNAGQTITPGAQGAQGQQPQPIQAYVLATDVEDGLQATQQIQNLSRL